MNRSLMLLSQRKRQASPPVAQQQHKPAPQPEKPSHTPLSDILYDGAWQGKRCFIIGGGPSLKGFDFQHLTGELVIGINRAYEVIDPAVLFSIDQRFWDWAKGGKYGSEALSKWFGCSAVKAYAPIRIGADNTDIYQVQRAHDSFRASIAKGITCGNNSGLGAVSLAVALGADPVYLLGFDLHDTPAQEWWHDGHPKTQTPSSVYPGMRESFVRYALDMKARAQVINCNPDSALRCFEFGDLPSDTRRHKYRVVSFYTTGTSYEQEIKKLEQSLRALQLPYRFFGFPPVGTWRTNLNFKSQCILEALDMFPGEDIVFLDSDAVVRRNPVLFDELSRERKHDMSAHFFQYSVRSGGALELLSGTLWLANNETIRKLVRRWHEVGLKRTDVKHQQCLKIALTDLERQGIRVRVNRHPFAYTAIFDYPAINQCEPVIEHFQASRRFRREVGFGDYLKTGET